MEPVPFSLPGYRINEYLLVLSPPEELSHRIQKVKEAFTEKYRLHAVRSTRPHVLLASFLALEMMEDRLLHRLHHIGLGITPFRVELKDYGSFPTHSLFINVTSRLPVQNLVKEIKTAQQLMRLNAENKPYFTQEPYIMVARKLKPWQYEQSWLEYAQRQFTGRFIADSMLLLSRPSGSKAGFQVAKRFDFMNLPVSTKQASLFA